MNLRSVRSLWRPQAADSLGQRIGSATAWSSMGSILMRLGTFIVGIVAARLIAPEQFGVFAIAITVHAIIVNASDLGVSTYIVRTSGRLKSLGPTVTTIAIASAALITAAMALSAPWISAELGSAAAADPVRLLSLTVLLAGVSSVPSALLTREFRQDKLFLANAINFGFSTAILVSLAVGGGGALALAGSRVAGQAAATIALLLLTPMRFRPGFDRAVFSSVVRFGLPLVGSSFLGFLIGNVDFIVVGRQLGAEPLGLYYLAFNIGSWAFMVLGPIVASVSVAAFSRVRSDRKQLGGRMGTAMSALVLFAFPASALIAGLAEPLVHAIYGSRWTPAAAALALTAIYGALRVPAELLYNVTIVEGYTRKLFILQIAYLVVLTPLTAVCVARWGIAGAGLAHIVANVALLLPGFLIILSRSTGFTARRLLTSILPPAAAATIVGFVAHLLASQFGNPWVAVSVGSLAGFLLYFTLIQGWGRRVARAGWHLWKDPEIADVFDDDTPEQRESRTPLAPASPESAHA